MPTPQAATAEPPSGVDAWVEDVLDELMSLPGVRRAGTAVVEGGGRRLLYTASDRERGDSHTWCQIDALSATPLNDAIGTNRLVAGPISRLDDRYTDFVQAQDGTGFVDIAVLPLATAGPAVGGFVLYYGRPQPFDPGQRAELEEIAARHERRLRTELRAAGAVAVADLVPQPGSLVAEHETPPDTKAVVDARHFLRDTLAQWRVDDEVTGHAVLCLSELVTNALIHTGGGCHVQVELRDGVLTTRVHDNGAVLTPQAATATDPDGGAVQGHGHGLRVVAALADEWGRTTERHGSAAWFALDLTH